MTLALGAVWLLPCRGCLSHWWWGLESTGRVGLAPTAFWGTVYQIVLLLFEHCKLYSIYYLNCLIYTYIIYRPNRLCINLYLLQQLQSPHKIMWYTFFTRACRLYQHMLCTQGMWWNGTIYLYAYYWLYVVPSHVQWRQCVSQLTKYTKLQVGRPRQICSIV